MSLDVFPSPIDRRPGLVLRDPYRYSDATLVIPPLLVPALGCLDGKHDRAQLADRVFAQTGQRPRREEVEGLIDTLRSAGFFEDATFERLRDERHRAFRDAPDRPPVHAGGGYPEDSDALTETLDDYRSLLPDPTEVPGELVGIAAPHVSPFGGPKCYSEAYRRLDSSYSDRTFVILGTSHYGDPDRFGLTRKSYITPYGDAQCDRAGVDFLERAGGASVSMEDYCHAIEHSIEFQVVFLQHAVSPRIKVLPILCGPFVDALYKGTKPESSDRVRAFFDGLAELAEARDDLFFVLGVDLAHVGARYGDGYSVQSGEEKMREVEADDRSRLELVCASEPDALLDRLQQTKDELKWCGFPPLYTFLKALPGLQGHVTRYDQWNIDQESVVSFCSMDFVR